MRRLGPEDIMSPLFQIIAHVYISLFLNVKLVKYRINVVPCNNFTRELFDSGWQLVQQFVKVMYSDFFREFFTQFQQFFSFFICFFFVNLSINLGFSFFLRLIFKITE